MFRSAGRNLALVVVLFSSPAFAQLTISNGDATWGIGRVEWQLQATGGTGGYSWSTSGALPPGLVVRTDTPPWFNPGVTAGLIGVATTPGTYNFALQVKDSANNTEIKSITVKILGLVVTIDGQLADASVGVAYNKTIGVAGATGGVSFALAGGSLPDGLSLNPFTGEISGSPTTPGDYNFNVDIADTTGTIDRGFSLRVSPMHVTSPATLQVGTQGTSYSQTIGVAGGSGTYDFSLFCCAPGWLSLDPTTGVMSGTPDGPGFWGFTVRVDDGTGFPLRKHYQLGVVGTPVNPPSLSTYLDDIPVGDYMAANLNIYGGTPPYTWTVSAGNLPPGMRVENVPDPPPFSSVSGAWLVGTPTTVGTYTFTVQATDSASPSVPARATYTIRISPLAFNGIPNTTLGASYSQQIWMLGGTPPYKVIRTMGQLPYDLTLSDVGLVSGTVEETGSFWSQIRMRDSSTPPNEFFHGLGSYVDTVPSSSVNIQERDFGYPLVNQYVSWRIWACCGSGNFNWNLESGPLPPGLGLSGFTGPFVTLSGVPTSKGSYTFLLRAADVTDATNFSVRAVRMTVTSLQLTTPPNLPWGNTGSPYPATQLTVTGNSGAVTWSIESGYSLPEGMSLSPNGVISGTPTYAGQYNFQLRATDNAGESIVANFNLALYPPGQTPPLWITSGDPSFQLGWVEWQLNADGGTGIYTWTLLSGSLPTGLDLRSNWQPRFPSGVSGLVGIATSPGTYNFVLKVADNGGKTATRAFTVTIPPIVTASNWQMPDATINVPYDQTILAAKVGGGTLTFSLPSGAILPPGLNLANNGHITGTPTAAGTYDFDVLITGGTSTLRWSARIYVSSLTISTPEDLPNATQGVPFSQGIAVSGGTRPYTYSLGCCAGGELSLNPSTGILSGTVNGPSFYSLEITVTDSAGAWARKVFKLGVIGTPPVLPRITTLTLEDLALGTQNWSTIGIYGGTPPYNWSMTSGSLPPGISITSPTIASPTGGWRGGLILGGAATATGTYTFTLQATDSGTPQRTTSQTFNLRVSAIAFANVPDATFGVPYSQQLPILGGAKPYLVSVGSGEVPEGLTVSSTGLISGTPKVTGYYWFQLRVSGAAGEVVHGLGFNVYGTTATWMDIQNGGSRWDITPGAPWGFQFSVGGGTAPYTWSKEAGSTLPAGMQLSTSGFLSGVPAGAGVKSFLVGATDAAGNFAVRKFQLNITPINVQTGGAPAFGNLGIPLNFAFTTSGGTGTVTWSMDPNSSLPPGLTLNPNNGTISGTPTVTGDFWFSLTATDSAGATHGLGYSLPIYAAGETPPLYINVGDATVSIGYFDWRLDASGGTGTGYTYSLDSGILPPGLAIRNSVPSWVDTSGMPRLDGVASTPGVYPFTLQLSDLGGNKTTRTVTITVVGLVMTNDWELADASVGVPYTKTITTAGATGSISFALQSWSVMPLGLALNPSTGVISGTPTTPADYNFNVNITDSAGTITRNLHLHVSPMQITSPASPLTATQGTAYSQAVTVTGGTAPYSYALNCCTPGWLSLNATTGVLSGMPDGPGFWGFGVEITDSASAHFRKHYQLGAIGVPAALPGLTTPYFDDMTLGEFIGWSLGIWGGTPPFTWSVSSGTLPPGLSVQNTPDPRPSWTVAGAWLVGVPTAVGDYTFVVQVVDSSSPAVTTSRSYTVHVSKLAVNGIPEATFGTAYSEQFRVLGGEPPYTVVKAEGNLPSGLSMDATGLVTGTPTETGSVWLRLLVTDSAGTPNTFSRSLNVNVATAPRSSIDIQGPDLGSRVVSQYFNRNLNACCGTFDWTLETGSSLPDGLSLSGSPGPFVVLGGTPTTLGSYSFSVRATDPANPANFAVRTFQMTVTPLQLTVSTGLPWGNTGSSYSTPLTITGNTGAVTWSIEPGYSLPAGMSLSADGVLSGIPTGSGEYWIQLRATDAGGASRSWGFNIAIYPSGAFPPVAINNGPNLGTWSIGKVQDELSAQGGNGTYTWTLVNGNLPPGISLRTDKPSWFSSQASAGLVGLATTPGTYTFTLRVDSGSASFTRTFTMKIVSMIILDPSTLPDGFVGQAYPPYTFTKSGTAAAVTWSSQPGNPLPPGLTLSAAGVLSGTPTTAGYRNFTIYVSDGTDTIAHGFNINVYGMWITTPRVLPNGKQGDPYTVTFAATNAVGSTTWNANWTPPGLTLLPGGTLTGTPTQAGTSSFWITVTDSNAQFYQLWCTLNVVGVPPILPSLNWGTPNDLSLGVESQIGFSVSGGTAPYTWLAAGMPPGMSPITGTMVPSWMDATGAMISGTPTALGSFNVTVTATDHSGVSTSQTYTLNVVSIGGDSDIWPSYPTRGQPYQAKLRVIGGTLPYTWSLAPDQMLPAGLTLAPDANNVLGVVSGTPLENGNVCPRIVITDNNAKTFTTTYCFGIGGGRISDSLMTTININTGSDLGWAMLNGNYSRTFSASGAASYTWGLEGLSTLPAGLSLSANGVLSGTPTEKGSYTFLIRAADSSYPDNYGVRQFRLKVTLLTVTSNTNLGWTNVGTAFSSVPTIAGNVGVVTWSLYPGSALPPGLSFNPSTGAITGTPTSAGNYYFNLLVSDPAGATSIWPQFRISIYPTGAKPPLFLGIGPDLGMFRLGPVGYTMQASGGSGSYTYSYAPNAPPIPGVRVQTGPPWEPWWSSSTTGALLGVITSPGTYSTTIRVTDSSGQVFDRAISFQVSPIMPLTNDWLPRATVGTAYSFTFSAAGGTSPYTWSLQPGNSLPPGVTSLTSDGILSGTPTTPGTCNFQLRVTDAASNYLQWNFNLEVMPFAITTSSILPQGTANSAYSVALAAEASGVTWSMASGGLPGGLSLDSATGVISGTPTGRYYNYFTIRATSGSQSSLKNFALTIVSPTAQPLSISNNPVLTDAVLGRNQYFTLYAFGGTPPYTWSLESPSTLPPGLQLVSAGETVCNSCAEGFAFLTGAPTTTGDYAFTLRVTDAAVPANSVIQTFTWHVAPVSNEYQNLPISDTSLTYGTAYSQVMLGIGGTNTFTWTAEGTMPPGLSLSAGGTVSGTPTDTGGFNVPVRITDGTGATFVRNVYFNIAAGTTATLSINVGADLGIISQGSLYSRDLYVSGSPLSSPNYSFSTLTNLPAGCALLTGNALPWGTPTAANLSCSIWQSGTYIFTIKAEDAAGNFAVKTFTLRVTPDAVFTSAGAGLYNAATGVPFSQKLIGWGTSQTWSVAPGSSLPPGLTLAADGTLSGNPTTTGTYTFTLRLADASGLFMSRTFTMTVAGVAITSPGLIPVQATLGQLFTYDFSSQGGGANNTWSVTSGSLPTGISLSSAGRLSGTTAAEGNYTFIVQVTDGTTKFSKRFTLVVRQKYTWLKAGSSPYNPGDVVLGQSFSRSLPNGGGVPPYNWSFASGSFPPGLALLSGAALPANYNPIQTLLAGMPTTAGQYTFTLRLTDSTGASLVRTFKLNVSSMTILNYPRDASYNTPYSQALTATGGTAPYSFALDNGDLPPGFTLSSTGLISGTTTNTGYWYPDIRVTDADNKSVVVYSTVFVSAPAPQTIDIGYSPVLPDLSAGVEWSSGGLSPYGGTPPYTWSLYSGILTAGFTLDPNSGSISGRAPSPGTYTFTIRVQDNYGNFGYKTFTQRVTALQIFPRSDSTAFAGSPVNIQLSATGGIPPYTFVLNGRNYRPYVPVGLTLNPNGTITGTTNESGLFYFDVTVTDSSPSPKMSSTFTQALYVYPAGSSIPLQIGSEDGINLGGTVPTASVNTDYLMLLAGDRGPVPYTLTLTSGSLPPGMKLISGGGVSYAWLTGAPSSTGDSSYSLRVDAGGQTLTAQVKTPVGPLSLSPDPLPPANVGTPYSVTFVPMGGTAPYSLQWANDMPPGLSLSGMTLSGTPTIPGVFVISYNLLDSTGASLRTSRAVYVDSATTPLKALNTSPANVQVAALTNVAPAPVPLNIDSGTGSVSFTAAVAGIAGASLSIASGTTPQAISLQLPGLPKGTYYGMIEINSTQAVNAPLAVRVVVNVVDPPPCSYSLSPPTASIDAGGGAGSFNVGAASYCPWTATASKPWITLDLPSSGSGNGAVSYSLSANPESGTRSGTVSVGGQTHTITQFGSTCAYTINPAGATVVTAGMNGTIAVNASLADCPWTASSNDPSWIEITSGSSGTGSGSVGLRVSANGKASGRSGTVDVAGVTFTVDQAGSGCIVGLSSGGADFPASGGGGSVNVTTNGCAYSTVDGPSWITVTSGGSGSGSGTLNYTVGPNSSTQARSGSFLTGGQPFQITQTGMACSFTVNTASTVFGSSSGSGSISVESNGANCGWTASIGSDWLKINSGTSGKGSGSVSFSLIANSSSQSRAGTIVAAGQTVTITQSGVPCGYTLRSSSGSMPASGGTGSVGLVTAGACAWTATSNSPAWLSVVSASGSGSADVYYVAQPNNSITPRAATLTVAGQAYTLTQAAAPCTYSLSSASVTVGPGGAIGSFSYTPLLTGCIPTAVSLVNWITVSTDQSNKTVIFTVAANPLSTARSGTIQLGDQVFTVTESAAACSFSLNAFGAIFNSAGGAGDVLASSSALGCIPVVGASPELIPLLGQPTQDQASKIWTQPYGVPRYDSFNLWIRVLQISISGEIFTIKQTSW